ncbi:hypothetical protein [Prochlorococcus marinus]|uniref:hypothetical protein n=1 Tax=Prochlorococcus marinus TaxID=1219 RepID=UPI001ADC48AD|nr:hypothetical protein [Prochlorococcus marinus]MBO8221391.1 hypothetical protein [Prochlorococcus marinus CUG1417]MBW3074201.1 hypothetical protein [Prochlorococcus marinus str. MU1417]
MALIFSSGGGRLGNQLLNLIHLQAFLFEYDVDIFKVKDSFIICEEKSFLYKLDKNRINWRIVSDYSKPKKVDKLFLKIFIRIIHIYYYLHPKRNSYKLKLSHKFILGKKLNKDFSRYKLIQESKEKNIVLSGWGLRDWDLVIKHKDLIINNLSKAFLPLLDSNLKIDKDFLFVHIRRSDFLKIANFKELNFLDDVWLKSIIKVCQNESLNRVVIFSDSKINLSFISKLESHNIKVLLADNEITKDISFLDLFVNYLYTAKAVICNASTLALSLSFMFHEKIYLPSKSNYLRTISLNNAHKLHPISLNWN